MVQARVCIALLLLAGLGAAAYGQDLLHIQPKGNVDYDDTVDRYLGRKAQKVVGGKPAKAGAYPWQVSLQVSWIADPAKAHFCGGSIYNERWIVTAAHCLVNLRPHDVVVVAGTIKLSQGVRRVNVARLIQHNDYHEDAARTLHNDIGLIQLFDPLIMTEAIKPVELLSSPEEQQILKEGQALTVTGWGATSEGSDEVIRELVEVEVPFVTRKVCNDPLSYNNKVTANMIVLAKSARTRARATAAAHWSPVRLPAPGLPAS